MSRKIILLILFSITHSISTICSAQDCVNSGFGGTSNEESIEYSIGQIFYSEVKATDYQYQEGVFQISAITIQSINNIEFSNIKITEFPNPVTDFLQININNQISDNSSFLYQIADINGKIITTKSFFDTSETIDLQNLEKGLYILSIFKDNKTVYYQKIVKI